MLDKIIINKYQIKEISEYCDGNHAFEIKASITPEQWHGKIETPKLLPERYIINDGATILFWRDGTKSIVKRSDNDDFDPIKGFLWAYFQKHCGLSKTKANKYLWKIQDDFGLMGYTVVYRNGKFELIKE